MTEEENPWREGAQELMDKGEVLGAVIFAGMSQTADITQQVMDNLAKENWELHAQLSLIVERVTDCFNGIWTPDPRRVLDSLYPSREDVRHRAAELKWDREQGHPD